MESYYLHTSDHEQGMIDEDTNDERRSCLWTKAIVDGYKQWMKDLYDRSRETFFVNFMFREMSSSSGLTNQRMQQAVERFYGSGGTRFSRHPTSRPEQLPTFVGMPDLPVQKRGKRPISHHVNDGFHFNGLLFVPD